MEKKTKESLDILIKDTVGTKWNIPHYIFDYIIFIAKEIDMSKGNEIESYIKSKLNKNK